MKTIGVISDTHGLLRPEALAALRGCDLIVHAGDIGTAGVMDSLRQLGPVFAVRGNVDRERDWAGYPATQVVEVEGRSLLVLHDIHDLDLDPVAAGFAGVISGHSHRPSWETRRGVWYLNPGSAGPRRFDFPVTVARLQIGAGPPEAEIVRLRMQDEG